jgi:glycosyltransferase involved in cell wall biosynthesis
VHETMSICLNDTLCMTIVDKSLDRKINALVAYPGNGDFAQQVALAFLENEALVSYATTFRYRDDGCISKILDCLPSRIASEIRRELLRRAIVQLPNSVIEERPFWEVIRTMAAKARCSRRLVDQIWDIMSRDFTRALGRRLSRGDINTVYAYEYTALEAFEVAETMGIAKVLDLPSLHNRSYESMRLNELSRFPELVQGDEEYFVKSFEARQARRDAEVSRADVIITNSSVTRRSHIDAGADPKKIHVVPCGSPPPIKCCGGKARDDRRALSVVWAGSFSVRKGAHLVMAALRSLPLGHAIMVNVYGSNTLPEGMVKPVPRGIHFYGSIPRSVLFNVFEQADVLLFPTLSDGFGMVVTEAFSRGLPVITTKRAGAADLVIHGRNGLIIPAGSVSSIAEALQWCLDNRKELAEMRHSALQTAAEWQWSDYRRALMEGVMEGLRQRAHVN